ncbi:hypothetical protein QRX60_39475 [Amycolatopsis mongoliensis]|uniref:Uncharacterized protein n=1 Tax=Amycolatopsis mongoliensis TaxID=715475 RepID=A0A9Y2JK33_9PSEU|nr:hypothetical protein [Amycolatopsis sp. 4-36]WIY00086.1 hypothetical protein QRX60_39475 [Amycolatopsis sp. 4-36]
MTGPVSPVDGRLRPAPSMLYASTVSPYRRRCRPGCGVSVDVGAWLRPNTSVHCSISSCSSE